MKVQGAARLKRKLARIVDATEVNIKATTEHVLNVVAEDMRRNAPVDEGEMRDAIGWKVSKNGLEGVVGVAAEIATLRQRKKGSVFATRSKNYNKITVSKSQVVKVVALSQDRADMVFQYYKALWVEFGTKGYDTPRKNKKGQQRDVVLTDGLGTFFGKKAKIPPRPARPFIEPAWDANKDFAKKEIFSDVNKAIKNVARSNG